MKAEMAKNRKKRLGKIKVVPVKNSKSERKNGLRERAKIPVVTNSPVLFSFIPKRIELPKCFKVVFIRKTERKMTKTPVKLINTESKSRFFTTFGSRENPYKGLKISVRKSRKKTAKTG